MNNTKVFARASLFVEILVELGLKVVSETVKSALLILFVFRPVSKGCYAVKTLGLGLELVFSILPAMLLHRPGCHVAEVKVVRWGIVDK